MRALATSPIRTLPSDPRGAASRRVARRASRVGTARVSASGRRGEGREDARVPPREARCVWGDKASGWCAVGCVALATAAVLATPPAALAAGDRDEYYIEDIPQGLSSGDSDAEKRSSLSSLVRGANTKEIEKCTGKCIVTCTRGGGGAPGLGPLSVRKAPVVFKEGFRSRQYCLNECTEICSITVNSSKGGR